MLVISPESGHRFSSTLQGETFVHTLSDNPNIYAMGLLGTRARGLCVCVNARSYLILCDSMDCSPPGSSVHGIFQARTLKQVVIPSPGDLPNPGIKPLFPALAGGFFTTVPPGKPVLVGASPLFSDLEIQVFQIFFEKSTVLYCLPSLSFAHLSIELFSHGFELILNTFPL